MEDILMNIGATTPVMPARGTPLPLFFSLVNADRDKRPQGLLSEPRSW